MIEENFSAKLQFVNSAEQFGGKVRSFVRSAENFGGKFELFAALYDDSCEPQFFTYVFFGGKFRREIRIICFVTLISGNLVLY